MSDSEKHDVSSESSSEKQIVSPQSEEVAEKAANSGSDHEESNGDDGKPLDKYMREPSESEIDLSDSDSAPDTTDQATSPSKPAENTDSDTTKVDKPTHVDSTCTEMKDSTTISALSIAEPTQPKVASDPSPDARPLRGEDDSEDTEQFFTPTATPPIIAHEISSRTMTEAEEEELMKLRMERNSDNRRRNAFYGGNQEAEKKKIGLDPKETIAEPTQASNSGIATTTTIRCTLGKRNDKLRSMSNRITVAYADTQGRRPSMEDDFVFIGQFRSDPHLDLVGLFDGHRGTSAARYATRELSAVLDLHMKHAPKPRDALHEAFLELHKQMRADDIKSGTTAIVSLLTANKMFIAHAGDSRAVLCRDRKAIRLTTDHRPDTAQEIERITKLGGDIQDVVTKDGKVISRVAGLLGVSRALGDFDMEPFVTPQPEVAEFSWGPEEPDNHFVIVACDGLWECVSDQEAVDIAKHFVLAADAEVACKRLRDVAYARGSTDNITVCIIQLSGDQNAVPESPKGSTSSSSTSSSSTTAAATPPNAPPAPHKKRRCTIL